MNGPVAHPVILISDSGTTGRALVQSETQAAALTVLGITGVLTLKGNIDASGNPNYPAALKGDLYYITVAGKVGGASGKSVDVGDAVVAKADNAGGTEASVGTSWFVMEHNLAGALLAANNLSDVANAATARTNLGATTVGASLFTVANPSAITFPRINANNTVSMLGASDFRTAIGINGAIYTSATCVSDASLAIDSVTFGTDNTAALQAILDLAATAPLTIIWDGRYSCTGLKVRGNTAIVVVPGCGGILRNSSNKPLISNYNPTAGTILDENIEIHGGIWNGNGANQSHDTVGEGWIVAIRMMGVRNLILRDLIIYKPRTFAIHCANWEHVHILNPRIDVGSTGFNYDGIHMNGPGQYLFIRDCLLKTEDDSIAISPNDIDSQSDGSGSVYGPFAGPGDIADVLIDGVQLANGDYGIRLFSTINRLDRITISKVSGQTGLQWLLIDNYSDAANQWRAQPPGEGNFGNINVTDIDVEMVRSGYKECYIYVNAKVDSLRMARVNRSDFTMTGYPTLLCDTASNVKVLDLSAWTSIPNTGNSLYTPNQISLKGSIGTISIKGCNLARGDGAATGYPINNTGTISELNLSDNMAAGFAGVLTNGGTISNSHLSNNSNDAVASTWTLEAGIGQDYFDPGILAIPFASGPLYVAQKTASDAFSGNVMVQCRLTVPGTTATARSAFIFARGSSMSPWTGHTAYSASIDIDPSTPAVRIYKGVAGTDTQKAILSTAQITTAVQYRVFLIVKDSGLNVVVSLRIQKVSDGTWLNSGGTWSAKDAAGQTCLTWTDTSSVIAGAGKVGMSTFSVGGASDLQVNNFATSAAP